MMGSVYETWGVYTLHIALWCAALYRVGWRPCIAVLLASIVSSIALGEVVAGNERVVMTILSALLAVVILAEMRATAHDRLVAGIFLTMIPWATAYGTGSYMSHYPYAVGLNCAVVAQLLIAGGWADDVGRRIDRWADRVHPRGARILRHVVA